MQVINISKKYPLVEQLMSHLRDIKLQKDSVLFKKSTYALGQILGLEISCHMNYKSANTTTPFGITSQLQLSKWPTIIPILRAGRVLQEGCSSIFINSPIVDCECNKSINGQKNVNINCNLINPHSPCIICDPIIAKGKSLISTISTITEYCSDIYVISCITTNYALSILNKMLPKSVMLFTCAIDNFTPNQKISPGIGDAGDLLFGPKTFQLRINSLYNHLNKDAKRIPKDANVKLIFRHSFRDSFVDKEDYRTKSLNEYGIMKAQEFGKSIEYPLGNIYSSTIKRCIETLEHMTSNSRPIITTDYLTSVFTYDNELADKHIRILGSLKNVLIKLKNKEMVPGFYPIDNTVKKIINFLFDTGNKQCCIDLYCTHDFHIGLLLIMMFDDIKTIDDLIINWPNMLEGMLIYGSRKSFYCIWRGKLKHFDNYFV